MLIYVNTTLPYPIVLIIAHVVIERPRSEHEAKIVQELLSQRINSNYEKSVPMGPRPSTESLKFKNSRAFIFSIICQILIRT